MMAELKHGISRQRKHLLFRASGFFAEQGFKDPANPFLGPFLLRTLHPMAKTSKISKYFFFFVLRTTAPLHCNLVSWMP